MEPIKRLKIYSYCLLIAIGLILLLVPLALRLEKTSVEAIFAFSIASSIFGSIILALLTSWTAYENSNIVSVKVRDEISEMLKIKQLTNKAGLKYIFLNRNESLICQQQIFQQGKDIFILATTLNSLLSYRTKVQKIIEERCDEKDQKLKSIRILFINPDRYKKYELLNSTENIDKLLKALYFFNGLVAKYSDYLNGKLEIYLTNHIPIYFLVGNENKLLVSHYDYKEPGSQPVLYLHKGNDDGLFNYYYKQFLNFYENERIKINVSENNDVFNIENCVRKLKELKS